MRVAVGIITDSDQNVLITRRPLSAQHGGFWEFPGGKLEVSESPAAALIREIKEEVGLQVIDYHYLGEVCHTYDKQAVSLLVYHVSAHEGEAVCLEHQMDLRWVDVEILSNFEFPAANHVIIEMIKDGLMSLNSD